MTKRERHEIYKEVLKFINSRTDFNVRSFRFLTTSIFWSTLYTIGFRHEELVELRPFYRYCKNQTYAKTFPLTEEWTHTLLSMILLNAINATK